MACWAVRSAVPAKLNSTPKNPRPARAGLGSPTKTARTRRAVLFEGCLTMTYFRTGDPYYHRRLTVSRSCSGWEGVGPAGCGRQALMVGRSRASRRPKEEVKRGIDCSGANTLTSSAHGYGIKPHGLLVPVSSRHYCPSTPGLSTWWSATTLQGG